MHFNVFVPWLLNDNEETNLVIQKTVMEREAL